MKLIDGQLIANPEEDQQGAGNPERKSRNIDKREKPVPKDIPEGHNEVVLEHTVQGI